jgi:hypothetical protein
MLKSKCGSPIADVMLELEPYDANEFKLNSALYEYNGLMEVDENNEVRRG